MATKNESGTVKSVDVAARTVTLDNGHVFKLAASADPNAAKVGARVTMTYDDANGGYANATFAAGGGPANYDPNNPNRDRNRDPNDPNFKSRG